LTQKKKSEVYIRLILFDKDQNKESTSQMIYSTQIIQLRPIYTNNLN